MTTDGRNHDPEVQWEKPKMKAPHRSVDKGIGLQPSQGSTGWISVAVFAACGALYIAEAHGFRIFDESLRGREAADVGVPSPLEILTLLGTTSLGVCAGLVALITFVTSLVRRVRHADESDRKEYADGTADSTVQPSGS